MTANNLDLSIVNFCNIITEYNLYPCLLNLEAIYLHKIL